MGACLSCGGDNEPSYSPNSSALKPLEGAVVDAEMPVSNWPSTDIEGEELNDTAQRLGLENARNVEGHEAGELAASFESHPLDLPESEDDETTISESSAEAGTPSPTYTKTPAAGEFGTPGRSDLLRTPAGPLETSNSPEETSPKNRFSRSSFKRMLALDLGAPGDPKSYRSPLRALQPESVKRDIAGLSDLPLSNFRSPENSRVGLHR